MNYTPTGRPFGTALAPKGLEPLDATGHPINPDEMTVAQITEVIEGAHANCTECSACGAGWDRKLAREVA